jgi:hypothetical protein
MYVSGHIGPNYLICSKFAANLQQMCKYGVAIVAVAAGVRVRGRLHNTSVCRTRASLTRGEAEIHVHEHWWKRPRSVGAFVMNREIVDGWYCAHAAGDMPLVCWYEDKLDTRQWCVRAQREN